jgi:hypothetical protein
MLPGHGSGHTWTAGTLGKILSRLLGSSVPG